MVFLEKKITKKGIIKFIVILTLSILWLLFAIHIKYECPINEYLHLWCPGCGGTRMLISFIHGNFYQSFRWNPLLFILLIVLLIYCISFIVVYIKKKVFLVPSRNFFIFLIVILILFMILRNIDLFNYLIPTEV